MGLKKKLVTVAVDEVFKQISLLSSRRAAGRPAVCWTGPPRDMDTKS
jgi:hypothetical protein